MKVTATAIPDAYMIDLDYYGDERGFFYETYQCKRYSEFGIEADFVQDNISYSKKHVLRGLHYQVRRPIGQLISVIRGQVFDVGVDLRPNSSTYGQHIAYTLSADKPQQLYLPPGVAHGFCSLAEENEILYKCTEYYDKNDEAGLLWNDPRLAINWPVKQPQVNPRDSDYPKLNDVPHSKKPEIDS